MGAVRLRTLRKAIADLLAQSSTPEARAAALDALLAQHANRAYRPGAQADADEPAYHTAAVVVPEVWRGLRQALPPDPAARLALADALWARAVREPRLLAARVLSQVPAPPVDPVFRRFWAWLRVRDHRVRAAVLEHAAMPLTAVGEAFLQRLTPHLPPQATDDEAAAALQAVARLMRSPAFDNTPVLFRLLRAGLQRPDPALRPEWVLVLRGMLQRWPAEALPFWRRLVWETADQAGVLWLLRRVQPTAPEPWRARLAALLDEARAARRAADAEPTP